MTEATRGWIYRMGVLALIAYVIVVKPNSAAELVPVILGAGNVLASVHTRVFD